MDYTENDVRRLVAKIESLALEPGEQAALDALIAAAEAETDDVAGFGFNPAGSLGIRIGDILAVQTQMGGTPDGVSTTMGGTPDGVSTQMGGTPEGFDVIR